MCLINKNLLVTSIHEKTDDVSQQIMLWEPHFTQLSNASTLVKLNYTQLVHDVILNINTSNPANLFFKGLKNYTILVVHQNFQKNPASEFFAPIALVNDGDMFETNVEPDSNLRLYFFYQKKRKLQSFERLAISDIMKYVERINADIIAAIDKTTEKSYTQPNANWQIEEDELNKVIINELKRLYALGKKRIKKNEIKRRICRLNILVTIFNTMNQSIYLDKFAALAKVSPRSLQTNFLSAYGVSPTHFHKNVRLTAVRDRLYNSDPRNTLVSKVAIQHGFTHLGQFSGDYKQFFKQSPSETLRLG